MNARETERLHAKSTHHTYPYLSICTTFFHCTGRFALQYIIITHCIRLCVCHSIISIGQLVFRTNCTDKKKIEFSSYIRKFRVQQLQDYI
jgi:hypothetical protein